MAFAKPGHRPGIWAGYYYCNKTKSQKRIPAKICRQWDGLTHVEADRAAKKWADENGISQLRSINRSILSDEDLVSYREAFCSLRAIRTKGKSPTQQAVKGHIINYIESFFVNFKGIKDIRMWEKYLDDFVIWLLAREINIDTARKIRNSAIEYGEYLARRKVLDRPWFIPKIAKPTGEVKQTPLPHIETPEKVLEMSKGFVLMGQPQWAAYILLGFFASLRPSEIFSLQKSDFITGRQKAASDTKTYTQFCNIGLGSGLSVAVTKTFNRELGVINYVKTAKSNRVVNIWSSQGAEAIAAILKSYPEEDLFGYANRYKLDNEYKKIVYSLNKYKEYDWRRASGYHLGRVFRVDLYLLQDHFAHSSITTTEKYTRRPADEGTRNVDEQNWDDVS